MTGKNRLEKEVSLTEADLFPDEIEYLRVLRAHTGNLKNVYWSILKSFEKDERRAVPAKPEKTFSF